MVFYCLKVHLFKKLKYIKVTKLLDVVVTPSQKKLEFSKVKLSTSSEVSWGSKQDKVASDFQSICHNGVSLFLNCILHFPRHFLKKFVKGWEFRKYICLLNITFHPNWAVLAVLFSRQLQNGSQIFFSF